MKKAATKERSQPAPKAGVAEHAPPVSPPKSSDSAKELLKLEDDFYRLLAGGTRVAMLISMVDTGLAHIICQRGPMTEAEILSELRLHRDRGHKWVLLLVSVGLLTSETGAGGVTRYRQHAVCRALVDPQAPNHFFYRDFLRFWRVASYKDVTALLRGAPVPEPVRYPPVLWDDVVLLHEWMRDGALTTLAAIRKRFDFSPYHRILDVAGGDATMATTLVRDLPDLEVTVFNLPAAATLCRRTVAAAGLEGRVHVESGDFRLDAFPKGFELVMFSRVMADWSPEVCRMLMQKAHAALDAQGFLLIAEPLRDENPDLAIVWEQSYLPYDDFGASVYKHAALYEKLLAETGFRLIENHDRDDTIHSVILAQRID